MKRLLSRFLLFSLLFLSSLISFLYAINMRHIGTDMGKDTFHAAFDDKKVMVFANTKTGMITFQKAIRDAGLGYSARDNVGKRPVAGMLALAQSGNAAPGGAGAVAGARNQRFLRLAESRIPKLAA